MKREQRVDEAGRASAGSRLQVQIYVNRYWEELSQRTLESLPALASAFPALQWVSPLESARFEEYRDAAFLRRLGLTSLWPDLKAFWPRGGPSWDALAIAHPAAGAQGSGVMLVEAKSHPSEVYGPGCRASARSRQVIQKALEQTKQWLGVSPESDWMGPLYQTANRLAHLYFLREVGRVPAWYVALYFLNDGSRPGFDTTEDQWRFEIRAIKERLGLPSSGVPHAAEVFLQAREPGELLFPQSR